MESQSHISSTGSIVLGCTVAVVSSGIQSLGITLQRKSHLLRMPASRSRANTQTNNPSHHHHHHNHHHYQRYKRNMWLFGFMLFIVANVLGSLIQITTLPLIILSPLQSIGLIFNSILSCLLLPGEYFTNKLGVGTIAIAIGAFLIAYNGNTAPIENPHPPKDIDERFNLVMAKLLSKSFLSWFVGTFVMIGILLVFNYGYLDKKLTKYNANKSLSLGKDKLIGKNKYIFLKGFNFGIISGTLTAHTFLFAKSIIDVIVETILNKQSKILPLKDITPYLLLILMFATIGFQLTAFNLGLAQISTSILYPLCFLVYNLINLINDLTFNSLLSKHLITISQFMWITVGLVAVLFGVVIISWDSAFGKSTEDQYIVISDEQGIEEESFLYQKFPYNQQSQSQELTSEQTNLLPRSTTGYSSIDDMVKNYSTIDSSETNYSSATVFDSEASEHIQVGNELQLQLQEDNDDIMETITRDRPIPIGPPKRVLSFEQNQLLNSIDL